MFAPVILIIILIQNIFIEQTFCVGIVRKCRTVCKSLLVNAKDFQSFTGVLFFYAKNEKKF